MLVPLDVDAEGHHAAVTCEMDPVDHEGDQVEAAQIGRHQLSQGGLGGRHEPPGDRRFGGGAALRLHGPAHRLETGTVAAGGELGHHAGERLSAEHLGRDAGRIGRECHLCGPVGSAQPGTADRDLTAAQRHQAVLGPVPHGCPVRVVDSPRPGQLDCLFLQDDIEHLQPGADGEGQQALFEL
jgi:hypothetical protein